MIFSHFLFFLSFVSYAVTPASYSTQERTFSSGSIDIRKKRNEMKRWNRTRGTACSKLCLGIPVKIFLHSFLELHDKCCRKRREGHDEEARTLLTRTTVSFMEVKSKSGRNLLTLLVSPSIDKGLQDRRREHQTDCEFVGRKA